MNNSVPSSRYWSFTCFYDVRSRSFSFNTALYNITVAVAWWPGGEGAVPPNDNFLGALKFKGGAKIRNCQCEILYKICKIQLVNKFNDSSNSGISIAIQLSNSFWE